MQVCTRSSLWICKNQALIKNMHRKPKKLRPLWRLKRKYSRTTVFRESGRGEGMQKIIPGTHVWEEDLEKAIENGARKNKSEELETIFEAKEYSRLGRSASISQFLFWSKKLNAKQGCYNSGTFGHYTCSSWKFCRNSVCSDFISRRNIGITYRYILIF